MVVFKTDGCCKNPANIESVSVGNTEFVLRWEKVTAASAYLVRWKLSKDSLSSAWQTVQVSQNSASIRGLSSCSEYDVQIRSLCASNQLPFSSSFKFKTTGCGNCLEKNYCIPKGITIVSAENEWIAQVKIGDFVHLSGKDGYGDFTRKNGPTLKPGTSYPLTLEPGYLSTAYDEFFIVWMDLNQDGSFTNDEELFNSGSPKKGLVTSILSIPASATLGSTRMRIVMQYRKEPGACVFPVEFFGEIEDFCVNFSHTVNTVPIIPVANIRVFPNPSEGVFSINFQEDHLWESITMINMMGQTISKVNLEKGVKEYRWEGKKTHAGQYTLVFQGPKGVYTHRISIL